MCRRGANKRKNAVFGLAGVGGGWGPRRARPLCAALPLACRHFETSPNELTISARTPPAEIPRTGLPREDLHPYSSAHRFSTCVSLHFEFPSDCSCTACAGVFPPLKCEGPSNQKCENYVYLGVSQFVSVCITKALHGFCRCEFLEMAFMNHGCVCLLHTVPKLIVMACSERQGHLLSVLPNSSLVCMRESLWNEQLLHIQLVGEQELGVFGKALCEFMHLTSKE